MSVLNAVPTIGVNVVWARAVTADCDRVRTAKAKRPAAKIVPSVANRAAGDWRCWSRFEACFTCTRSPLIAHFISG